jgi:hypothetical protein
VSGDGPARPPARAFAKHALAGPTRHMAQGHWLGLAFLVAAVVAVAVAVPPLIAPRAAQPAPGASSPGSPRPAGGAGPAATTAPATAGPTSSRWPSGTAAQANPSGRNLALHRLASASSSETGDRVPSNAVDGDLATRWSSAFADPQWISVDLGTVWSVTGVHLSWQRAYATHYSVDVSLDGVTWTTVYATSAGQGGEVAIPVSHVAARYVRMFGTRRSGVFGYSLFEFEVR